MVLAPIRRMPDTFKLGAAVAVVGICRRGTLRVGPAAGVGGVCVVGSGKLEATRAM